MQETSGTLKFIVKMWKFIILVVQTTEKRGKGVIVGVGVTVMVGVTVDVGVAVG